MSLKMKNIVIWTALLIYVIGCKKAEFGYNMYQPTIEDVDSLSFSAGSNSLIADDKATLQFVVEAFRRTQTRNGVGELKDTMVSMDYTLLPTESVKVYANGQLVEGMTFKTNDLSVGQIKFEAQIGDIKSNSHTVTLRPKQVLPAKKTVDVIFHVLELEPTDLTYDPLTYQPIQPALLSKAIVRLNQVFNGDVSNDPNRGNMNIEFRLATKNPAGAVLASPGYNKVVYNYTWKANQAPTSIYQLADFTKRINITKAMQWDSTKYVNIYILPFGAGNTVGDNTPKYQFVGAEQTAIPGPAPMLKVIQNTSEISKNTFYETYGVGVNRNVFFPGGDRGIDIAVYFGRYYGVMSTRFTNATLNYTDYCDDTRKFNSDKQVAGLLKVSKEGFKFLSNNAMDDIRNESLRNTFTLDQVNRMQAVMAQSPVRKAWSLQ